MSVYNVRACARKRRSAPPVPKAEIPSYVIRVLIARFGLSPSIASLVAELAGLARQ